jgi:hypothetical protein
MVAQVGCSKGLTYVAGDGHSMANNLGIAFCQTLESPEPLRVRCAETTRYRYDEHVVYEHVADYAAPIWGGSLKPMACSRSAVVRLVEGRHRF